MKSRNRDGIIITLAGISGFSIALALGAATLQPQPRGTVRPPFNSTEQRIRMIQNLEQLNQRFTLLERKLDSGINVKVIEMPAVQVSGLIEDGE